MIKLLRKTTTNANELSGQQQSVYNAPTKIDQIEKFEEFGANSGK